MLARDERPSARQLYVGSAGEQANSLRDAKPTHGLSKWSKFTAAESDKRPDELCANAPTKYNLNRPVIYDETDDVEHSACSPHRDDNLELGHFKTFPHDKDDFRHAVSDGTKLADVFCVNDDLDEIIGSF
jgi:hypothetical protein